MKVGHGLILAAAVLAGCGPAATPAGGASTASPYSAAEAGFDGPPRAAALTTARNGAVTLSGIAAPGATVRLASPQGRAFTAVADEKGEWRVTLPRLEEPALFGLSSRREDRTVQAEGYVAVMPGSVPSAALLRAAAGASPIRPTPKVLTVAAVDVDAAGAAVVSGAGQAGAAVNALVDGVLAGEGVAGDSGRFTITLTQPLTGGPHIIGVRQASTGAVAEARLDTTRSQAPVAGPFVAQRIEGGWRIDWMTPGGGLQTTLLFDRIGAGA